MRAFYACFMKFCLALNSYNKTKKFAAAAEETTASHTKKHRPVLGKISTGRCFFQVGQSGYSQSASLPTAYCSAQPRRGLA